MLNEVRISDVGVISAAVLELGPGFTAITGETGAGKTMVLTGLAMLRGARVDPSLVRTGALRATAEGRWTFAPGQLRDRVGGRVAEVGGELEDDELLITRSVRQTGRGRCAVGGCAVPTAVLADLVDQLIAVHGQNDQLRLGKSQLGLLDRWAGEGVQARLESYRRGYERASALRAEITALHKAATERSGRMEFLEYQLAHIERVRPQEGEFEALTATASRLGHAEVLAEAVRRSLAMLTGDDGPQESPDALGLLAGARRAVDSVRQHDPALETPWQTLRDACALVVDAAGELSAYVAGVEADPEQLSAVEARRAELGKLLGRYGDSMSEVLAWEASAAAELAQLARVDVDLAAREDELQSLLGELGPIAQELHELRVAAADRFGAAVTAELAALAMPRAQVQMRVTVESDPAGLSATLDGHIGLWHFGRSGCDEAVILLSASPGAPLRAVAHAASGGELSRIMLAIHVVLAGADPVPTMVFDEVDAGVGGAAALEVGRRLAQLARRAQVLVVTHLAQVAAFADRQLVVTRTSDGMVTESSVVEVRGAQRVAEVARMLSGQPEAQAALAHAEELLESAKRGKTAGAEVVTR